MTNSSQATASIDLWSAWEEHRVLRIAPPCLRHQDVEEAMAELSRRFGERLAVAEVGVSFEGRTIRLMRLGTGDKKIMLWSQMHGDEPSATPALLDLVNYLLSSQDERARSILREFTLLALPMLNPDGTERATRRSAQGIDINRDALQLATPEGRLLKQLRAQYEPFLGFNLHDQDRRKLVGESQVLATQSVLAVAGDEEQTLTDGRLRAMRVCSVLISALEAHIPGGVSRFDEDWSARAFGDNLTAWGTPIVLLESGGLPKGKNFSYLSGLTFVGLVRSLEELARNDAADFSEKTYQELPRNRSDELVDVILKDASLLVSDGKLLRRSFADIAFDVSYKERELACGSPDESKSLSSLRSAGLAHRGSTVVELGDARFLESGRSQDLQGHILVSPFRIGIEGISAEHWLSATVLEQWVRLGVGEVIWRIADGAPDTAFEVASDLAESLVGVDRAKIRVVRSGDLPRMVVQQGPQSVEGPPALGSNLAAIAGHILEPKEAAEILLEGPNLRRFAQASFLIVKELESGTAAVSGSLVSVEALLDGQIVAVWYRGRMLSDTASPGTNVREEPSEGPKAR